MHRSISRALELLAGLTLAPLAVAGTLRCDGELFDDGSREGVYKQTVLDQCGEPDQRYGHTWIDQRGPDLRKVVQFDTDGQLQRIEDRR